MLGRGVMEDGRIPQAAVRRMIGGSGGCGADAELFPDLGKGQFLLPQQINLLLAFCQDG